MEYRFSLTPRLIALALFSGVALMVLLFALGFQVGQRLAGDPDNALARAGDDAERRALLKLDKAATAAAAPAAAPLKAAQKVVP